MDNQELSRDEEQQLQQLEAALGGTTKATTEAFSAADICEIWNKYKQFWPGVIKIVRRFVPKYGDAIATLLEKVGQLLDTYCAKK